MRLCPVECRTRGNARKYHAGDERKSEERNIKRIIDGKGKDLAKLLLLCPEKVLENNKKKLFGPTTVFY